MAANPSKKLPKLQRQPAGKTKAKAIGKRQPRYSLPAHRAVGCQGGLPPEAASEPKHED